eukprot:6206526-Pleurochrysis_carterae.AAC.1
MTDFVARPRAHTQVRLKRIVQVAATSARARKSTLGILKCKSMFVYPRGPHRPPRRAHTHRRIQTESEMSHETSRLQRPVESWKQQVRGKRAKWRAVWRDVYAGASMYARERACARREECVRQRERSRERKRALTCAYAKEKTRERARTPGDVRAQLVMRACSTWAG